MSNMSDLWEQPEAQEMYMIVGWRQWADAGSTSSGLPQYLIQQVKAHKIGTLPPEGFYIFQIPGTHDLVRPVVKFHKGQPQSLETPHNEFFYFQERERGVVFFLGDEPHLDIERYVATILDTAEALGVKRIIGLGGVYGELPYNKARAISCSYSLPDMQEEINRLAVNPTDYHGGASIGSFICQRARERNMEYIGLYAFVPTYDFSNFTQISNSIRFENDFLAWLGVMQRIKYMTKINFDLAELEEKSEQLVDLMDKKVEELEELAPQISVRDYFDQLAEEFTETPFNPLDEVWEDELRRLLDNIDQEDPESE